MAEVTQSEIGQKQKLQTVLEAVHGLLRPHGWALQWTVDCEWSRGPPGLSPQLAMLSFIVASLGLHVQNPFVRLLSGRQ